MLLELTRNVQAIIAGVAQSVEHVLGKDGVMGSIPVSSLLKC